MEIGDVGLHLGGGVNEQFHLTCGYLQDFEFAIYLLVAISDEGISVFQRVQLAERGIDKDCIGDEGAFYNHLLALNGCISGSHRTIGT